MLSGRAEDALLRPFASFDFASRRGVIAAVSGGSDSTALLILLKTHLDRTAPGVSLLAVTIDHGLRAGSDAEAHDVARLCAGLGVAHRTLAWVGPKPSTGIAAAAREARYRLLSQAADEFGTDLVLTGHTADDQAETVLMRAARDEGRGMAGMAPTTLHDGRIWIVRPLLGTRREDLQDHLRAQGFPWIDDPTNSNLDHERPRLRAGLAGELGRGKIEAALAQAGEAATRRERLGETAARLIRDHARKAAPGLVRLDKALFTANGPDAAIYALRILLACVGGTPFLHDGARAAALYGRLADGPGRAVLSRALLDARRDAIFLLREARGLPAPSETVDGMIWDGRYRVSKEAEDVRIGPHGAENARDADPSAEGAPASLVRAALAAEPVLWPGEDQASAVGVRLIPILAPWAHFLPSFDLAPARAAARLFGAAEVLQPPFRGHIAREA